MLCKRLMLALAILPVSTVMAETRDVPRASVAPVIDGKPDDPAWAAGAWREIDKLIIGESLDATDFSGRYQLAWTPEHLYLLAEITDDVLYDGHANPTVLYWDDDALEIFVDEDASGGEHQFDYNAFAYHVALDNQAVDIGPFRSEEDQAAGLIFRRTFPKHVQAAWQRSSEPPYRLYWEVRLTLYSDDFTDAAEADGTAKPVTLVPGKEIGFMVSWCDADDGNGRQHFIGDIDIEAVDGDRNRGWIDAGVFGRLRLAD